MRENVLGPKHFDKATADWSLRALRRVAAMPREDRIAYQSAGTMRPEAQALEAQGKYVQAQPLAEKALDIRRRLLTDDHPATARSYTILGLILQDRGDYAAARRLYEKGLEIRRKLLSEDHPDTAESYNNLGHILHEQGNTPRPGGSSRKGWRSAAGSSRTTTPTPSRASATWRPTSTIWRSMPRPRRSTRRCWTSAGAGSATTSR